MKKIPTTSQVSLSKGLWFIFRDGETEIAAHFSAITGQEQIFVNGELILQKKSFSKTSELQFTVNKSIYKVLFLSQILLGTNECSLVKNGKCIRTFKTSYKPKSRIYAIDLLISAVLGFILAFFRQPFWLVLFVLLAFAAISLLRRRISIDEVDV